MAKNGRVSRTKGPRQPKAEGPLVIKLGRQGDGGVYQLDWRSEERIHEAFPHARITLFAFLGYPKEEDFDYENDQEFEKAHRPLWPSLALILTGLTFAQISELGGVCVHEPATERRWHLSSAETQRA